MSADDGVWGDNPSVGVFGASSAAQQGICHLAALFGRCVGSSPASDILCAGQSLCAGHLLLCFNT